MDEQETRRRIVEATKSWLSTPYHHHANIKGLGVDCAMILAMVYHEAGVCDFIDPRPYPTDWMLHHDSERYLEGILPHVTEISRAQAQPGDFAVFKFGRTFSHSAIIIEWPTVIHAYIRERSVVLADITKAPFVGRPAKFFNPLGKK
jgi:cell wall-associated NlpC family hydrolase